MNRMFQFSALIVVLILTGFPAVCQVPTPTPNPNAWRVDLNSDGQINAQDFFLFRELWHTQNIVTPTPTGTPTSTFTATRTPTQEEISPYVSSTPPRFALVGELLLYPIVAVDPNGDSITFAPVTVPAGMTVSATGLVKWTPAVPGKVDISIGLTDGKNPQVLHEFTLHVGVAGTEASGVVTSTGGGTVEVNDPNSPIDGTRVEIPPGTLTEDATVTIRSISDATGYFPNALPIEISGLPSVTATIEVPYDPALTEIYGFPPEDLFVYSYDSATDEWVKLPRIAVKSDKSVIVTTVSSTVVGGVIVVGSEAYYHLFLQTSKIIAVKGGLRDFFDSNTPRRRLMLIHGVLSYPDTFRGPYDFLPPEGSPLVNQVQTSLWNYYDSIVVFRYPSGYKITDNAGKLVTKLVNGYSDYYGGRPPVVISSNPNFRFDILAHSMGGMLSRWFIEKQNGFYLVNRLVTLGTPHNGFGNYDNFSNIFAFVIGLRATFQGLAQLANGITEGDEFLGTLNQTNPPSVRTTYYCIAGLYDNSVLADSDGKVTQQSARYLNLPLTREKTFGPDGDRYKHSNLHELAATNGVGQQVLDWLLTTPAPTRTPTATPIPYTGERVVVDLPDWPYPDPPEGPRKLEFVRIPAGSFMMGSENERGGSPNESPRHEVVIDYDFYLGVTEVTQLQWRAVWGSVPGAAYGVGNDYPVYYISWNDIQTYLFWLNGLGIGTFRLPSEAEWEYACRAGTTSPPSRFSFGPNLFCTDDCASCPLADQYMWWCGNAGNQTREVAQKLPNQWGLYDMHGNVWEWVRDEWHSDYNGAPEDGRAWETVGSNGPRVIRGGSWGDYSGDCRSAARDGDYPGGRVHSVGLRLVLVP